jgi:hypothetical protein
MTKPARDKRTEPARERAYVRLYARIEGFEDTINHFYNVINEIRNRVAKLHDRVSMLEKSKPEDEPLI